MMFPAAPPDGGFLVLNDAQIGNLDLVCAIKSAYPRTRIYAQGVLSREVQRVMNIGKPVARATGIVGYLVRRDADARAHHDAMLRAAMAKVRANSV